jgi:putative two-component system response regulator
MISSPPNTVPFDERHRDRPLEVLLVEDNPADARLLQEMVRDGRHTEVTIDVAPRLADGLRRLGERAFDLVLLDLNLPDAGQLEALHRLCDAHPELPVVVVTGLGDEELARQAAQQGAQDYLVKGSFGTDGLVRSMLYAVERQRLTRNLRGTMDRLASSEERLRRVVTSNPDPVLVVDGGGIVRFANPAATTFFGSGAGDLVGKPLDVSVPSGMRTEVELPGPWDEPASVELWAVDTDWEGRPAQLIAVRDVSERRRSQHTLWRAHVDTIQRLVLASELKDRDTAAHVQRIGEYCVLIARGMGLAEDHVELLRHASQMHDVGKIGVPDSILLKPGPLTDGERSTMQEHTLIGARLLHGSPSHLLHAGEVIALTHHERWDGGGYPQGLAGDDIPLSGRVCAVADFFDALTSDRPYRGAVPVDETLGMMRAERGRHFDPQLLDVFAMDLDQVLEVRRRFVADSGPPPVSDLPHALATGSLPPSGCPCSAGTAYGLDALRFGVAPEEG